MYLSFSFAKKPYFSILKIGIGLEYAIGCMYPFGICTNSNDFDSWVSFFVSQFEVILGEWRYYYKENDLSCHNIL